MELLESAKQLAEQTGKMVSRKAVQVKEVLLLKSRVDTCEELLQKNYLELGKLYFELYGMDAQEPFRKVCRNISNAKRGKEELSVALKQAQEKLKEM